MNLERKLLASEDTYDSPFGEPTLLASSLNGTPGLQSGRNGIIVQWAEDLTKVSSRMGALFISVFTCLFCRNIKKNVKVAKTLDFSHKMQLFCRTCFTTRELHLNSRLFVNHAVEFP